MIYKIEDIEQLNRRFRANLINSILGFKPVNLIGTLSNSGISNLALFNSTFHLGASPPLIGMISRPHTVPRHTLENILENQFYTINHVSEDQLAQSHQTSAKYIKDVSEFESVGFEQVFIGDFPAPFVGASPVKIGLKLVETVPIKVNSTIMIIGKILLIELEDQAITEDGNLDYEIIKTIATSGLNTYFKTEKITKLPYAKP